MTDEEAMRWVVDIALAMDESDGDMQANVLAAKVKAIAAAERERIAVTIDNELEVIMFRERTPAISAILDEIHEKIASIRGSK